MVPPLDRTSSVLPAGTGNGAPLSSDAASRLERITGGEIGRGHHHHDQRTQRPGIVDRQPWRRQAGADALDRIKRAFPLLAPQRLRHRVIRRESIGQRGRRTMADAGAAVEATKRLFAGRPAKAYQREQRSKRQSREQGDANDTRNERQRQPQSGPGDHQKQSDDAQKSRESRPGALPGDRVFGPLQSLRQLKPRDCIRLAHRLRGVRGGGVQ